MPSQRKTKNHNLRPARGSSRPRKTATSKPKGRKRAEAPAAILHREGDCVAIKSTDAEQGFELCILQENAAADAGSVDAIVMRSVDANHFQLPKSTPATRQSLALDIILGPVPLLPTDHDDCFRISKEAKAGLQEALKSHSELPQLDGAHNLEEIK